MRKALQQAARPPELGDLEISVTPAEPLTLEDVERYVGQGIDIKLGVRFAT